MSFVPNIVKANYNEMLDEVGLSEEIRKTVIFWEGKFTEPFKFI